MFFYFLSESGATAVEYGLIAAGIALLIVAAVFAFGADMSAMFESLSDLISGSAE